LRLIAFTEDLANPNEIVFIDTEISKYCCNEKTNKGPEKSENRDRLKWCHIFHNFARYIFPSSSVHRQTGIAAFQNEPVKARASRA